ncbi:hypothetical protein CPA40_01305 [Bifidobacterium callitrichos]|uniref:Uncharacterized protein n=2 Tax=Bifidobacterium callitrichos TaxID=762209 RepID=A0A2T3GDC5_9BIFI|nr:hypothetical protein CPA40_01305 [Bifidobacterium callitrichos]
MRSVLRAYRMDWHKVSSQGWMWVPAAVLAVPVLVTAGAAAHMESLAVVGAAGAGYFGGICVCLIWVYLIMVSLLCPLMYRFSIQKVGIWFMVVVLALCFAAVGGLAAVAALVPKAVLDRALDGVVALADNMMLIPILAVVGIATAALALAVSFRVSCRFYLAKEL